MAPILLNKVEIPEIETLSARTLYATRDDDDVQDYHFFYCDQWLRFRVLGCAYVL